MPDEKLPGPPPELPSDEDRSRAVDEFNDAILDVGEWFEQSAEENFSLQALLHKHVNNTVDTESLRRLTARLRWFLENEAVRRGFVASTADQDPEAEQRDEERKEKLEQDGRLVRDALAKNGTLTTRQIEDLFADRNFLTDRWAIPDDPNLSEEDGDVFEAINLDAGDAFRQAWVKMVLEQLESRGEVRRDDLWTIGEETE